MHIDSGSVLEWDSSFLSRKIRFPGKGGRDATRTGRGFGIGKGTITKQGDRARWLVRRRLSPWQLATGIMLSGVGGRYVSRGVLDMDFGEW